MRTYLISILGLLVIGCSTIEHQEVALNATQACCEKLSQAPLVQVSSATPVAATIDEQSPRFKFDEGKSYFVAFRLPDGQPARRLLLKTHVKGFLVTQPQVFCPAITFTDNQMRPLSRTGELPLRYDPPTWGKSGFWFVVVPIPSGAASLVVHTPADAIGSVTPVSDSSGGSVQLVGKTPIFVPGGGHRDGPPCGHHGEIELEVR